MMILQSLRWQPTHGYAPVQHLWQRSNDLLQVEQGSFYPTLQRMLRERRSGPFRQPIGACGHIRSQRQVFGILRKRCRALSGC
jgi:Transcriptional regulator PadR-like family